MTEADRPRFTELMAALVELYGEEVSEQRAELYFDALADLPIEAVDAAVKSHLRSSRFFPRPVELRPPRVLPDPGAIYEEILAAKRHAGWEHSVPGVTPLVAMVIDRIGGWRACWGLTDDYLWLRVRDLTEGAVAACEARGISLQITPAKRPALPGPLAIAAPPQPRGVPAEIPAEVAAVVRKVVSAAPPKAVPAVDKKTGKKRPKSWGE